MVLLIEAILVFESVSLSSLTHGLKCSLITGEEFRGQLPRWHTGRVPLPAQESQGTQALSLGQEGPLEEDMAAHSSVLAWEIPWTEEPGGPRSMGLQSVGQN